MTIANEEFVVFLYEALFDRESVAATDVAYWSRQLKSGRSPIDLLRAFLSTPEGHQRFFKDKYFAQFFNVQSPAVPFHRVPGIAEHIRELKIVDVGAMRLAFERDVYHPLLDSEHCRVVGFEPIEERRVERAAADPTFEVLPHVVGDGSARRFYRTAVDATSSIYEPNAEGLARFAGLAEYHELASVEEVQTVRLDDLDAVTDASYLKIDVQGAELDVLRGAERLLASVPIVHLEVSFFPMYVGQPLAADVDRVMRQHGFEVFDFTNLERYYYRGDVAPSWQPRRLLWADAVYVRDQPALLNLSTDEIVRVAWVMHEVYGAYDFSRMLMQHVEQRDGSGIGAAYDALLATAGGNREQVSQEFAGRRASERVGRAARAINRAVRRQQETGRGFRRRRT